MSHLFTYQKNTLKNILHSFSQKPFVILRGEKGTGKTFLSEYGGLEENFHVIRFQAELKNKFMDYNCVPVDLRKAFDSSMKKKKNKVSLAKDIASTLSNLAFISVENILETLLSTDEKNELDAFINFFIKKENCKNQLFIFDSLDNYDNKGLLFLHKIIGAVMRGDFEDTKVLVLLDTSIKGKKTLLDEVYLEQGMILSIEPPSDEDLAPFVDKTLYPISRHIPMKYLMELRNDCNNIEKYYNDKLDSLCTPNDYIKRIILSLSLFDEALSFHNLALLLSELSSYELVHGLEVLTEYSMLEKFFYNQVLYYKVPDFVRNNIRKNIPEYIALYRFEIFVRKLEEEVPFSYLLKYRLYFKIENFDNAYANAVLAYCSIIRGDLVGTNEELLELNEFLMQSPYNSFFQILENSYKAYNLNEYNKCYNLIDDFFNTKNIWKGTTFSRSIYLPEFILEFIYLREMCVGRIYEDDADLIEKELLLLKKSFSFFRILKNNELFLRMKEKELLLQSYISAQTRAKQRKIVEQYFKLCDAYKEQIRKSNTVSLKYWEIRYASFLYKVNIIPDIPDKKYILQSGFLILERNKENFYKKYLRAACNYAGDLMWRNHYKDSLEILENATSFIISKNIERYWGVILQMRIFAILYAEGQTLSPKKLLCEYEQTVWENYDMKNRMHEPFICKSNYAILLAASGRIQDARYILEEALEECRGAKKGSYNQYLLQTNLGGVEFLLGNFDRALRLEGSCKKEIDEKLIPTFSYPFLKKRNLVLCELYQKRLPVDNILIPLKPTQILSTGYCSDNYMRLLLFSDINYWTD